MTFEPINDEHAVVVCQFAIAFRRSFSISTFEAIEAVESQWSTSLPAQSRIAATDVNDLSLPISAPKSPFSLLYALLRPDGSAVWQMRVSHNQIDVRCSRYSRWDATLQTATDLISKVIDVVAVSEQELNVFGTALAVVDEFRAPRKYNLEDLALRGQLLPDRVFASGGAWHAHFGWFEPDPLGSILDKIDFDTQIKKFVGASGSSEENVSVSLEHSQQHRFQTEAASGSTWQLNADTMTAFKRSMKQLHERNKDLLRGTLQPAILQKIGLRAST